MTARLILTVLLLGLSVTLWTHSTGIARKVHEWTR
jgi:hypothetical protein